MEVRYLLGTLRFLINFLGEKPVPFVRAISESIGYGPTPTKEQSATALRLLFFLKKNYELRALISV